MSDSVSGKRNRVCGLKKWMKMWVDYTNDFPTLEKVFTVMKTFDGMKKDRPQVTVTYDLTETIIKMLYKANPVQLKRIYAFLEGYLMDDDIKDSIEDTDKKRAV